MTTDPKNPPPDAVLAFGELLDQLPFLKCQGGILFDNGDQNQNGTFSSTNCREIFTIARHRLKFVQEYSLFSQAGAHLATASGLGARVHPKPADGPG